ncbi:hypothetical protein AB0N07_33310 [Streptomyces sp. NPDC051172]|uniref:hypothetical protein n=1 Tax=Streptomyces sp. NPDC051172 TaxID=3155796 RepID=UPI003415FFE9
MSRPTTVLSAGAGNHSFHIYGCGQHLRHPQLSGGVVVLLDGTLARTRRRTGADDRKNLSGKHKAHGDITLGGSLVRRTALGLVHPTCPSGFA